MNAALCQAIRECRVVRFFYEGGVRDVEPHCHGCSKDSNDLLRGYQIGGYSSSGDPVAWKMFRLDRLSGLSITEKTFSGPRPEFDRHDDAMATIYCSL